MVVVVVSVVFFVVICCCSCRRRRRRCRRRRRGDGGGCCCCCRCCCCCCCCCCCFLFTFFVLFVVVVVVVVLVVVVVGGGDCCWHSLCRQFVDNRYSCCHCSYSYLSCCLRQGFESAFCPPKLCHVRYLGPQLESLGDSTAAIICLGVRARKSDSSTGFSAQTPKNMEEGVELQGARLWVSPSFLGGFPGFREQGLGFGEA